jgi:hypothetical protein
MSRAPENVCVAVPGFLRIYSREPEDQHWNDRFEFNPERDVGLFLCGGCVK